MAALTDLSDVINRLTGGNNGTPEFVSIYKPTRYSNATMPNGSVVQNKWQSVWQQDGSPGAGSAPTSGAIPTRSTNGALPFTAAGSTREKWPISLTFNATTAGNFLLYDRLYHIGGLSGTSTVDQTVQGATPSPALTRNTSGSGNCIWYEVYATLGTTQVTITATYTNQAGTTGRTATTVIGGANNNSRGRFQRFVLQTGDSGVQAVEKIKLSGSTGTIGNFGITIGQPILYMPVIVAGGSFVKDFTTGLPWNSINNDSCLAFAYMASSTTPVGIEGNLIFIEK